MNQLHLHASIAVVEDERTLCEDLVEYLVLVGHSARGFGSAEAFLAAWPACRFDLIVLDLVLPGVDGMELARIVRARESTGIVMLTSLSAEMDRITGLDAGADIYLQKGCSLEVIEASCRSVLRRLSIHPGSDTAQPTVAGQGVWQLQIKLWQMIAPNGTVTDLTHAELMFLTALLRQPGAPISRTELLTSPTPFPTCAILTIA